MVPKGRHTIKMCLGTACYVKGIKEALSRIENEYQLKEGDTTDDRRFSLEAVRCLGACGLAPVMVVDQDTYGDVSSDKVIELLEKYS
jgi:NADH:ubiquinone oxidoreductase subunit E